MRPPPGLAVAALAAGLAVTAPAGAAPLEGFDCLIEPHAVIEVSTREQGVLEEIAVRRGDRVRKGDVLARLESGVEELAVQIARARAGMRADLESKQVTLKYLRRQLERIDDLFKRKAVPFNERDQAATDVLLAEADLRSTRESLALARIELERAEQALARRTIHSPVDGVVVERRLQPGESVNDRPIVTVAEVDPLNVEVILPVGLLGRIGEGARAEVRPLIPGGEVREAKVVVVDRVVDAASNTFGVRLELANPDLAVPGGVRCEIRFLVEGD